MWQVGCRYCSVRFKKVYEDFFLNWYVYILQKEKSYFWQISISLSSESHQELKGPSVQRKQFSLKYFNFSFLIAALPSPAIVTHCQIIIICVLFLMISRHLGLYLQFEGKFSFGNFFWTERSAYSNLFLTEKGSFSDRSTFICPFQGNALVDQPCFP